MNTHNICFNKLVQVIQISTHNICFYKENQNTYRIASLNTTLRKSSVHIPLKYALIRKIFYYNFFPVILKNLSTQCSNTVFSSPLFTETYLNTDQTVCVDKSVYIFRVNMAHVFI